jgi:DNA (cytosine-5)-methyltransferase 1
VIRYGSVCSGIEAASAAWEPLGWKPAFFSEIENFPRAVLTHRFHDVPLHGDFTTIGEDEYGEIDLLVGGTPCQSFSIAGLRGGLDDDRGNLALEYCRLADRKRPRWLVWENVPGVLSSGGGRDFGSILGALGEIGYGFAYRVLDAQYFGVAQRRRRVFVVGYLGDWRRAAAVLFERHSLSGHPAPRRETGQGVAQCLTSGTGKRFDPETKTLPLEFIGGVDYENNGHEAWEPTGPLMKGSPTGGGRPLPAIAFDWQSGGGARGLDPKDAAQLQRCQVPAVAFQQNVRNEVRLMGGNGQIAGALQAEAGMKQQNYIAASAVRRLTPRECERLQGFPEDWTLIPYRGKPADQCPDGPRYKALGNSMAVPVMAWIGKRIQMVEAL